MKKTETLEQTEEKIVQAKNHRPLHTNSWRERNAFCIPPLPPGLHPFTTMCLAVYKKGGEENKEIINMINFTDVPGVL